MYFLVGVVILILFSIFVYFFSKKKIRNILDKAGFTGMNLSDVIKEARLEDQEEVKSLSSMDSIYLEQIKKDFPDININELKRKSEKVILDVFNAVEKKDASKLNGKIKSYAEDMINDYKNEKVRFNDFKIHKTVISSYKKDNSVATIYFSSSFQYFLETGSKSVKIQDRAKVEFIYIIDEDEVKENLNVLGIHCPNCGSPIKNLGEKKCSYCGSAVKEIIGKVFICNDIVRY